MATAESCTGGLVGAEVTAVPGSSAWYLGGWVVYDNTLKQRWAGVESEVLERHGAVSEPVARRIAEAVRERSGAHWGIGITGVAGPDGGTADKPVGLVHVSLASRGHTWHWKTHQPGNRDWVRRRSVAFALDRLRRALLEGRT
jgi:nicotinamide-nucleotide amidase